MKSLFVVSLPRSLSSHVHAACAAALGLRCPFWTSDGEIMNNDRSVMFTGSSHDGRKFTESNNVEGFAAVTEFLSHIVQPEGYAYKDVVQPFVVSRWLREHQNIPVLRIAPNIAHVASAMINRNWLYPTLAAVTGDSMEEQMISGLLRAASTIESTPGEVVSYDDLLFDLEPLWRALRRLYPGEEIRPIAANPDFAIYREEVLGRRTSKLYNQLRQLEHEMRAGSDLTGVIG